MSIKREKRKFQNLPQRTPHRVIMLQDIPSELQPLAIKIAKLEKALLTTRDSINMSFDHLIDLLVNLKKTSMDLINAESCEGAGARPEPRHPSPRASGDAP